MEHTVYCNIKPDGNWIAKFAYEDQTFVIEGQETQDTYRNEIQSTLEILQFLRNWVSTNDHFIIYTNSQYCISCVEKWIPSWITKGFRIGHTGQMRPNSDLLVKLHAFGTCMKFDLVQHYDDYEMYQSVVSA